MGRLSVDKGPDGKFISGTAALSVWLPALLDAAWSFPLHVMLESGAHWCDLRAAKELRLAAVALEQNGYGSAYVPNQITSATKWFTARDILLRTINDLREIGR